MLSDTATDVANEMVSVNAEGAFMTPASSVPVQGLLVGYQPLPDAFSLQHVSLQGHLSHSPRCLRRM
eukprot:scaffold123462_cov15-Tisochrysis_lutea.AAC.1